MSSEPISGGLSALQAALGDLFAAHGALTVAVSGGVDSMTLAVVAHRLAQERPNGAARVTVFHAVSPAVPPEATARVRHYGTVEGWRLRLADAGELADPDYRRNPADRCFYCKHRLYDAIEATVGGAIAAGTNRDDLDDVRPGLVAARHHGVHHPYLTAGFDKAAVRALAHQLGLEDLAPLPASPCLASRVETGITIAPDTLRLVHAVERLVSERLRPHTVRCRVRRQGLVIELDPATLTTLGASQPALAAAVGNLARQAGREMAVGFAPYRMGSAFLRP